MPLLSTLSAHPIIAIIGLVAVLLTTLYASNEKFRNSVNKLFKSLEPLLDIGTELLNGILEPLTDIFQSLFDLLGELAPFITDVLNVSLASIAVSLIPTMFVLETIYKLIESVITGFKDLITLNWGGFADNQKAIWSDWKSDDFRCSCLENLKNSINNSVPISNKGSKDLNNLFTLFLNFSLLAYNVVNKTATNPIIAIIGWAESVDNNGKSPLIPPTNFPPINKTGAKTANKPKITIMLSCTPFGKLLNQLASFSIAGITLFVKKSANFSNTGKKAIPSSVFAKLNCVFIAFNSLSKSAKLLTCSLLK